MKQDGQKRVVAFQNTGQLGAEHFKKGVVHGTGAVHGEHNMGDTGLLPRREVDALVKIAAVRSGPCGVAVRTVFEEALKDAPPVQRWVQPLSEQTEKACRHVAHMLGALHGLDEFNVGFLFRLFLGCPAASVQYGMITYFSRKGHGLRTLPFPLVLAAFRSSVSTQQFGLAAFAFGGIILAFPFAFPFARLPAASFRLFGFLLRFRSLGTFIGGLVLKAGELRIQGLNGKPGICRIMHGTLREGESRIQQKLVDDNVAGLVPERCIAFFAADVMGTSQMHDFVCLCSYERGLG